MIESKTDEIDDIDCRGEATEDATAPSSVNANKGIGSSNSAAITSKRPSDIVFEYLWLATMLFGGNQAFFQQFGFYGV